MSEERRRYPRIRTNLDGHWDTAFASSACRVADISLGGCYVACSTTPRTGERVTLTIDFPGQGRMAFAGRVIHVETEVGFAVQFREMPPEQIEELRRRIEMQVAGETTA